MLIKKMRGIIPKRFTSVSKRRW